jgi:pseudouridine-5'-phosphate glycosidase
MPAPQDLPGFRIAPEVAQAQRARAAVVALESTLVAHGLPWPQNLEVGRAMEATVREAGATPATIAVVEGRIHVGLEAPTLERLARTPQAFVKAGVADLGVLCASGASAATTVSATAFAAARCGIRVFATGGIGGVHRGHGDDVSSDLATLARLPIAVVSAGAKAVLDLPRTLERLETLGVLVLGVGTAEFPAFYTRSSGLRLEHRVDTPAAAAAVCHTRWALGDAAGVLLAHPIPEQDALPAELVQRAIEDALADATARGVSGKALTPHLLAALARVTSGRSLAANRALALANARFGAHTAVALAALERHAVDPWRIQSATHPVVT